MGAKISAHGKTAVFDGVENLTGAPVYATDLRAGAALVVAALIADGVSIIDNIYHIDRGCEALEQSLSQLGAEIKRV